MEKNLEKKLDFSSCLQIYLHNDKRTFFHSFRASGRQMCLEIFLELATNHLPDKFHITK